MTYARRIVLQRLTAQMMYEIPRVTDFVKSGTFKRERRLHRLMLQEHKLTGRNSPDYKKYVVQKREEILKNAFAQVEKYPLHF